MDAPRCFESDYCPTNIFIDRILELKETNKFISLTQAQRRIKKDIIRLRNYVVLTFDDGYKSSLPIYHWLDSQQIPYTLFINGMYLNGDKCSKHILERASSFLGRISEQKVAKDLYLSVSDIQSLDHSLCQIASHGLEHIDASSMSSEQFKNQVSSNFEVLESIFPPIAFHAYTWGRHGKETDHVLKELNIIPVLMDGQKNYNDASVIHREEFPAH